MKKISVLRKVLLLLLAFPMLFLTACGEGLMAKLGFDTHDYRGEKVLAVHEPDSEIARTLAEMTRTLTVASPLLPSFSGAKEAADVCRDAVLNHMLKTGYAQYAGNGALLKKAAEAYPQMQLSILIPAEDFASTVYESFGGREKITNKSGAMFRYLDKVAAYTTAALPVNSEVEIRVTLLEETERTYRLYFVNTLDTVTSPEYFALIIKREDGSLYFSELSESKRK